MVDEGRRPSIKTDIAQPARVYDYWLGGKDNFASDREVGEKVLTVVPEIRQSARANRAFLGRAVRMAAQAGIRQFLDIGSGLPTAENTHEIAQRVTPDAQVIYVDNDPIVLAHGRALLGGTELTTVIQADVREPDAIVDHPEVRRLIDFEQPLAVLLLGVLHFVSDDDGPYEIVARLREVMAPGSYLILSHLTGDSDPDTGARFIAAVNREARAVLRDHGQVERFFEGFELLEPGVVPVDQWRPDGQAAMERFWLWGGVGQKK